MTSPIKIAAILIAKPGRAEDLQTLLLDMAPLCRAETANLRWDVWRDQAQPDCYLLDELYSDEGAVAAHRQTAHYQHYLARIPELADRTVRVLQLLDGSVRDTNQERTPA